MIAVNKRKAQSILEYSLLIAVVVAALAVMQKYIRGALANKVSEIRIELERMH